MLVVDTRWRGKHGIGRFSEEVLPRIDLDWTPLRSRLVPSSPLDVANPSRLHLARFDQIYTPGYNAGMSRARQFLTLHDMIHLESMSEPGLLKRAYYDKVIRPVVKRAGMVFTVSEASKAAIEEWLADDVEVINVGNGCSEVFVEQGETSKRFTNYFIYVGNLKPHKNFGVLLEALALRPQFNLVVITPDSLAVRQKASEASVENRVFAMENVSEADLAGYYRGSRGLLFPSILEGFGLPAVEAASCGVPVAYWSGCASLVEIMQGLGVSVDARGAAEAWADAMDRLDSSREDWAETGSSWSDRYSWDAVAARVSARLRSKTAGDY